MRSHLFIASLFFTIGAFSQISIIPQPASLKELQSFFPITTSTKIVFENNELMPSAKFLQAYINKYYKLNLKISSGPATPSAIFLHQKAGVKKTDGKTLHSYSLLIEPKSFLLSGTSPEAVFNGVQTIIQLLPINAGTVKIPCVNIEDQPRFEYRGLHLDVGRHYLQVDFIKKYIDYIALHKMNYFHWHLTEDQGWRIEIKKYPKLTEVGAWRNGTIIGRYPGTGNDKTKHGGFYTQEQIKEIVKYAADRYIDVIPEIELPGHGSAAIAAYPQLSCFPEEPTFKYFPKDCEWYGDKNSKQVQQTWGVFDDVFCAGKDNTFNFLQDVMDEVMTLFPSKYIHVGGDECPKENWKRCPSCQARMTANGLKDEHELQSYFIQRMEKYLNAKGKTLIGWDEILEGGLAPKAVVMSWRGEQGGIDAAKEHHDVIMTPGSHVYLDHSQSENEDSVTIGGFTTLEKIYSYEPIPAVLTEEQGKYVLGAQGNVWTEYMKNPRKVEYMIFPRLSALSEVLWSPKSTGSGGEKRNWNEFEKKLSAQFKRYENWKVNYSKAYFDLKTSVTPTTDHNGLLWKLESKFKDAKIQYSAGRSTQTANYYQPIKINSSNIYSVKLFFDNKLVSSIEQFFHINKATGQKITLAKDPSKNYPGDGAFTLIDGIQNTMGRARSKEFLGFNGEDCDAVIDLGSTQAISSVTIHSYKQTGSWIWRPLTFEVFVSEDGKNFTSAGLTDDFNVTKTGNGTMTVSFKSTKSRYIKIMVKNWGEIPSGEAGAGNKAWLFVDEIEVN